MRAPGRTDDAGAEAGRDEQEEEEARGRGRASEEKLSREGDAIAAKIGATIARSRMHTETGANWLGMNGRIGRRAGVDW